MPTATTTKCWACGAAYDASTAPTSCPACGVVVPPHPAASPFSLLGYDGPTFDVDAAELERRWLQRSRKVHPDRMAKKADVERRYAAAQTAALNDAYATLKDPIARATRVLESLGVRDAPMPDGAFLAAMFDAREEAGASPDARRRALDEARGRWDGGVARLQAGFAALLAERRAAPTQGAPLAPTKEMLARTTSELRYLARLLDELGAPPKDVVVHV